METFYLVWEPQNGYTKHRHDHRHQAELEAERLAALNPGKDFYVLQALTQSAIKKPVTTIELTDLPY